MKDLISMDAFGRLVIPKAIRQSLNASRGAVFRAEVLGNRLELTLEEGESTRLRKKGRLWVVAKQNTPVDAQKAVEDTRKSRL